MTEADGWGWYAGWDDEHYTCGPEDSREAIIQAARNEEIGFRDADEDGPDRLCFHIVEARQDPVEIASLLKIYDLVEQWDCGPLEEMGPEGESVFEGKVTTAQWEDLQERLQAAAREWQAHHGIVIQPYIFTKQRNAESICITDFSDDTCPAKTDDAGGAK